MPRSVVDIRGIPFAEAVGADVGIAEGIAYFLEVLLNCVGADREQTLVRGYVLFPSVVAEEVIDSRGYGECALLPGLLFHDVQTITPAVHDDVRKTKLQHIADADTEVRFRSKHRCDPGVSTESLTPGFDGADDGLVLRGC